MRIQAWLITFKLLTMQLDNGQQSIRQHATFPDACKAHLVTLGFDCSWESTFLVCSLTNSCLSWGVRQAIALRGTAQQGHLLSYHVPSWPNEQYKLSLSLPRLAPLPSVKP